MAVLVVAVLLGESFRLSAAHTEKSEEVARERDRAGDLLTQLTELYRAADPFASPQAGRASRAVLDAAVAQLRANPAGDARTQGVLLFTAARVYRRLGLGAEARPLLEESVQLLRVEVSGPDEDMAGSLYELGACYGRGGDPERGIELLTEALEIERALHEGDHVHIAQVLYERGLYFHDAGRSGGDEGFREAVRIYRELDEEPTETYAAALMSLGEILAVTGGAEEAREMYEEANAILADVVGDHPLLARSYNGLGMLLYNSGDPEEGLASLRTAVEIARSVYGDGPHPDVATYLVNYGNWSTHAGDETGVDRISEALEMYRADPDANPSAHGFCLTTLGGVLRGRDPDAAVMAYEEALEVYEDAGVGPMFLLGAQRSLASLLEARGESERYVELLGEIVDSYEEAFGADNPRAQAAREKWRAAGGE